MVVAEVLTLLSGMQRLGVVENCRWAGVSFIDATLACADNNNSGNKNDRPRIVEAVFAYAFKDGVLGID